MKLSNLAKYALFGAMILVAKDRDNQSESYINFSETPTFDAKRQMFIGHPGGLDEDYLNSISGSDRKIYADKYYLNTFRWADSIEKEQTWEPIGEKGMDSQVRTFNMAMRNLETLYNLNMVALEDLADEYVPLKNMMNFLDTIYDDGISKVERLASIYEYVSYKLKGPGKNTQDVLPIEDLAAGKSVSCADVTAAYYSIFTYYGFKTSMRFGSYKDNPYNSSHKEGLHAWISVDTGKGRIDLDPSFYADFVPLDERSLKVYNYRLGKEYTDSLKRK